MYSIPGSQTPLFASPDCQACNLGYRFDGRSCFLHQCPAGLVEDYTLSTCWRSSGPMAAAKIDYSEFPLRQGFTYQVSKQKEACRMFFVFGESGSSANYSTFSLLYENMRLILLFNFNLIIISILHYLNPFGVFSSRRFSCVHSIMSAAWRAVQLLEQTLQ